MANSYGPSDEETTLCAQLVNLSSCSPWTTHASPRRHLLLAYPPFKEKPLNPIFPPVFLPFNIF